MNLLVVDDDDIICRGLQRRIMSMDIAQVELVVTAFSAEEALRVLREEQIDAVITDIQMVDMDGLDLIAQIRKYHSFIPCAVISAYDKFQYAQRAIRLDVEDFLLKPYEAAEIRELVEKLVKRGTGADMNRTTEKHSALECRESDVITRAKQFAQESFDREINMAIVANELNLNYSYFSRLFKKETGMTFSEYMLALKMREAGKLLLQGHRVEEITRKLGYGTTQNFTRAFTKYWGMSTRVFRERSGLRGT